MKKLLLTLVATAFIATGARAEETTTLVATLSHNGDLTAYYGKEALNEAYEAARDGDIITLSAGTFKGVNMSKNITVRGAGMVADAKTDNTPTILEGDISIKLQDNDHEFKLEGVWCTNSIDFAYSGTSEQKPVTVSKCGFDSYCTFDKKVYGKLYSCICTCNTSGWPKCRIYQGHCENCVFRKLENSTSTTPLALQNCVILEYGNHPEYTINDYSYFGTDATLTNCIIIGDGTRKLNTNNIIHNCVGFCTASNNINFFASVTNSSNVMVSDRENFFKESRILTRNNDQYGDVSSYKVSWNPLSVDGTGLYELSDEAKAIYKGNDGTVVGVWGGATPFNLNPSNPRITKCEIVPKVDGNGKLSVTIEVAQ